jgi:predicted polyphosphate/ATP-dependent NAD kinase
MTESVNSKQNARRKRLGLIVNPLAGIGGRVGLKGSDGLETVRKALELGAVPLAPQRAKETLEQLLPLKDEIDVITYPSEMGEDEARECGFTPFVIGSIVSGKTTAADTRRAAREMAELPVDLLLFVGGDGTARDVYEAISDRLPVLGVPAGVKIHSSVYAVNPRRAAELVKEFLRGRVPLRDMEVMDINEDEFRQGHVSAQLYGYLRVPFEQHLVQGAKAGSSAGGKSVRAIAEYVVDQMNDDTYYILGPGTTVKAVGDELGIDKTLLGVDVVYRKQLVGKDLNEEQLLQTIAGRRAKIVVTVIGGQGYIFGRGNQQISPRVIREVGKENLIIISTREKLLSLNGPLLVDTGDYELDQSLVGYVRVITGYNEESVWKVEC